MGKIISLDNLPLNKVATIQEILPESKLRRRLQDIGIVHGNNIKCLQKGPHGNLSAFLIKGAVIALRKDDLKYINVALNGGEKSGAYK